jgi:hypothetical protein
MTMTEIRHPNPYTNGAAEEAAEGKRSNAARDNIAESAKTGFVPGRDSSRAGGEDGSNDGRYADPSMPGSKD